MLVLDDELWLEMDVVYDTHLFQKRRFAALAGAQQQQLDLPAQQVFVFVDQFVDFFAPVPLFHLVRAELETQTTRTRRTPGHLADPIIFFRRTGAPSRRTPTAISVSTRGTENFSWEKNEKNRHRFRAGGPGVGGRVRPAGAPRRSDSTGGRKKKKKKGRSTPGRARENRGVLRSSSDDLRESAEERGAA